MDDLVTWLGEQLDADEQAALAVREDEREWSYVPGAETVSAGSGAYVACGPWSGSVEEEYAEHIARWDPARVLAEVEAKRAILRRHAPAVEYWNRFNDGDGSLDLLDAILRDLALPYRDRPGWRPEWALER